MVMNGKEDSRPPMASPEDIDEEEIPEPILRSPKMGGVAKDISMLKMVAIAFGVTIVIIIGLGMFGGGSFVTKSDFDQNWANIQAAISTSTADLQKLRDSVNNAVQGIPSMVNSQVGSSINQAVNSINTTVNDLSSRTDRNTTDLEGVKSRVTQLESQNASLLARIQALETKKAAVEEGTDTEALEVNMGYSRSFDFPSGQTDSGDISLYFEVQNTLEYDVEDVEIELVLLTRGVPIDLYPAGCVVKGGYPLEWQRKVAGNGFAVFQGISPTYLDEGLSIDADDDATVFMTIVLSVPAGKEPTEDVTFYIQGKVTDYKVKS